jgi:N-carbamoylputrescine amidase
MIVKVAAIQLQVGPDRPENVDRAVDAVQAAAAQGAQIILLPELFEGHYFCQDMDPKYFSWAKPFEDNPLIERFAALAAELGVVLPVSFFEAANNAHYNSIAIIDATGEALGIYRKSHIPDGPGYLEKYYFNPGDTGFKTWDTRFGRIGVGICWDQWFPECARAMALQGADFLFYPTAIGSEPSAPGYDSSAHWRRVMQGHAGANLTPLIAANRIGREVFVTSEITFYGSSFIADQTGAFVASTGKEAEDILVASFDLEAIRKQRLGWGVFRDRRTDLYGSLLTLDGSTRRS